MKTGDGGIKRRRAPPPALPPPPNSAIRYLLLINHLPVVFGGGRVRRVVQCGVEGEIGGDLSVQGRVAGGVEEECVGEGV